MARANRAVAATLASLDLVSVRYRLTILGIVVAAWFGTIGDPWLGYDAHAYWAVRPWSPYTFDGSPDQYNAFRYSPAAAQVFSIVHVLPWPVFALLWFALLAALVVWLARGWTLAVLAFIPIPWDIYFGNIDVLLAAAIIAGFRYPATWSIVLLTKGTPGVGLLWFAVRREWRQLAIALGVTAAIAGVSFLAAPGLWFEWPQAILGVAHRPGVPIVALRVGAAALLIAWGARTDRRWTVVVGATLALGWLDIKTSALLVGLAAFLPPLHQDPIRAAFPVEARGGGYGRARAAR